MKSIKKNSLKSWTGGENSDDENEEKDNNTNNQKNKLKKDNSTNNNNNNNSKGLNNISSLSSSSSSSNQKNQNNSVEEEQEDIEQLGNRFRNSNVINNISPSTNFSNDLKNQNGFNEKQEETQQDISYSDDIPITRPRFLNVNVNAEKISSELTPAERGEFEEEKDRNAYRTNKNLRINTYDQENKSTEYGNSSSAAPGREGDVAQLEIRPLNEIYSQRQIVGKGRFGTVYRATRRIDKQVVALKEIKIQGSTDYEKKRYIEIAEREIEISSSLSELCSNNNINNNNNIKNKNNSPINSSTSDISNIPSSPITSYESDSESQDILSPLSGSSPNINYYRRTPSRSFSASTNSINSLNSLNSSSLFSSPSTSSFRNEERSCGIVKLFRAFYYPEMNEFYLEMEYIEGGTSEEFSKFLQEVDVATHLELFMINFEYLINTLELIHDRGILHRDIKRANLLWDKDNNRLLFTDFGTACYRDSGACKSDRGTPQKLDPSTLGSGTSATVWSDIYALGVTMFEIFFNQNYLDPGQVYRTRQRLYPKYYDARDKLDRFRLNNNLLTDTAESISFEAIKLMMEPYVSGIRPSLNNIQRALEAKQFQLLLLARTE